MGKARLHRERDGQVYMRGEMEGLDPIEDGTRDWEDYRKNYHATFAAQLLQGEIADYEIMPWPERIYGKLYPKSAGSQEMIRIPQDYATMMQVMTGSLGDIPISKDKVSGSQGISVLMGNSMMFQRFPVHEGYDDPEMGDFFGMAMPLLKRGIPVGITHIENVGHEKALKDVSVLVMTYSNMKPMDPQAHFHIAGWVKDGGRLIYCGRDTDPFQSVMEWWNTEGNEWKTPSDHLFSLMGIEAGAPEGEYSFGNGSVKIIRQDPKEFTKADMIKYVEENNIPMVNFHYVAGDGRIKTLGFVLHSRDYLEQILSNGERVDGSNIFPAFIHAGSSDLYVIPRFSTAFLNPFTEIPTLSFLCSYYNNEGKPLENSPEYILRKAAKSFTEVTGNYFQAMGELEYYVIGEEDDLFTIPDQRGYHESSPFTKFEHFRAECMLKIAEMGGLIKYGHSEVGNFTMDGKIYEQNEIEFLVTDVQDAWLTSTVST